MRQPVMRRTRVVVPSAEKEQQVNAHPLTKSEEEGESENITNTRGRGSETPKGGVF